MTQQLAIIDVSALDDMRQEIAALRRAIESATIKPAPEWVSVSEAASLRGCSASTISRLIASGRMEAKGAGKSRLVKVR